MGNKREQLRAKFAELEEKKKAMEVEISAIAQELNSPGPNKAPPVGMKGNLVDHEGFPRADVDVHAIRLQRNRYATLQNDHKGIMKQIEELLKEIMALPKEKNVSSHPDSVPVPTPVKVKSTSEANRGIDESVSELVAFLWVDRVEPGSPAESAGLRVGDRILRFGSVRHLSENVSPLFDAVVQEVGRNINSPIDVVIERDLGRQTLHLTPRQWSGRGMLGCNLMPVT
uniref:PDZ domain-containing protein n=2 Tax=Aplanochytrium stocchinoi TaxID=215587 RepID=A0A7S3LJE4_9STRA|mmetsp:Transcript_159/g.262  ORF Transcript_159/g.262 Transcript_159/m.262 type:complete len:228 (-) Transcript_159:1325-2008(-)